MACRGLGMTYEETPIKKVVKQLPKPPKNKKDKTEVNKETYKKTIANHNAEIDKLKQEIKKLKLLKKQAKITFKLSQMKEK